MPIKNSPRVHRLSPLFRPLLLGSVTLPISLLTFMAMADILPEQKPTVPHELRHRIQNAITLEITPKGQKLFSERLGSILGNLGVKLDEGYFPAQTIVSDKAIDLDEVAKSQPETVQIYKSVSSLLSKWLTGFSLNPHRPAIAIGESGYIANFSRFGMIADENLMRELGYTEGAVLAIELEVQDLTMGTDLVKAWDADNEFLGTIGLENVTIQANKPNDKIKIRLPFYVRANNKGAIEFKALEIQQNLDQANITLAYKKLLIPQMGVVINGKTFYLNNEEIEKAASDQVPFIIQKVRDHIQGFAKDQLPDLLNTKVQEMLDGQLEQIQLMEAPGTESGDTRPPLLWGMTLTAPNLKNGSLWVSLDGFVEDPINVLSTPKKESLSRGKNDLNHLVKARYDLGLSLDRGLINRVLQLSFERKNFEKITQSDGSSLKLAKSPTIDYAPTPARTVLSPKETFLKLQVDVEVKPDTIFLKETVVVAFDIIAKLRPSKSGEGLEIVLHKIDTSTLKMDPKYFSWLGSKMAGIVLNGIRDELVKRSSSWLKKDEVLSGSLPLPPEILGVQTELEQILMDPKGHLVLYLNYKIGNNGVKNEIN